jgi:hypothetical protein
VKQTVKLRFPRHFRAWQCVTLAMALALAGCSSNLNTLGDPASTGGASTVSQARGEAPGTPPPSYPAVHDMPPPRGNPVLTDYEQKKLENDLIAARRKVSPDPVKPAAKSGAAKSATNPDGTKSAAPQKTGNKQDP